MTREAGVFSENNWGCICAGHWELGFPMRRQQVGLPMPNSVWKLCMAYAPEAGLVRLDRTTSTTSSTTTIETKDCPLLRWLMKLLLSSLGDHPAQNRTLKKQVVIDPSFIFLLFL